MEKKQRLDNALQKLSSIQKLGPLINSAAMRVAITRFEDREVYVKSNNLLQLDLWDLETQRVLFSFENAHTQLILAVAASPDGKYLISGSADRSIAVWNLEKRALHFRLEKAHKTAIILLAVTKDNKYIISVSQNNTIGVWDIEKQMKLIKFEDTHSDRIWSLATAPNSDLIVSTGEDGITAVWSISKRKNIYRFIDDRSNAIYASTVTPDNRFAISGSEEGYLYFWDLKLGILSERLTLEGGVGVRSLEASADSKTLYCGCNNGDLLIWNLEGKTKELKHKINDTNYNYAICQLQFSANNEYLISAHLDGAVMQWNLNQEKPSFKALDHDMGYNALFVIPNTDYLVSLAWNRICIFSVEQKKLIGVFKERQDQTIHFIRPSLDGKELFLLTSDESITVLDLKTQKIVDKIPYKFEKNDTQYFAMQYDGENLVVANQAGKVISVISRKEKKIIHEFDEPGVFELALSKDLKYLVSGSEENMVAIWDYPAKKLLKRFEEPSKNWVGSLKFTDEGYLLVGGWEGLFTLWNMADLDSNVPLGKFTLKIFYFNLDGDNMIYVEAATSKIVTLNLKEAMKLQEGDSLPIHETKLNAEGNIFSAMSADRKTVYVCTTKGVEARNIEDPENLTFDFEIDLTTGHFSGEFQVASDSKTLIVMTRGNYLELWDLEKGAQIHRFDEKFDSSITSIITHAVLDANDPKLPSHQYMLLGLQDGSIEIWSLTDKKKLTKSDESHDEQILGFYVTSDNEKKKLVSCSSETILVWSLKDWTDLTEGSYDFTFEPEDEGSFSAFAVSSDFKYIVAGQGNSMLVLYSIEKQQKIATVKQVDTQDGASVSNVLITPDNKRVIVSYGTSIGIYAIEPRKLTLIRTFTQAHKEGITGIEMNSEDNNKLFSSGEDGSINVWDLEKMKKITSIRNSGLAARSVRLSPDGKYIIYSLGDNTINVLNIKDSGKTSKIQLELEKNTKYVNDMKVSNDKKYILTANGDRSIIVTDFYQKKEVYHFKDVFSSLAKCVALTPDAKYIIGGSFDKSVAVWDLEKGTLHHHFKGLHTSSVTCLAVFSDSRTLVTGEYDGTIYVLDIIDKKVIVQEKGHPDRTNSLIATTIQGVMYIISSGFDRAIRIWTYQNNTLRVSRTYTGDQVAKRLFLTANNQYIVALHWGAFSLWKFDQNETEPPFRIMGGNYIDDATVSADGKYLAATSPDDKSIRVWDIIQNRVICHLKQNRFSSISHIQFTPDLRQLVYVLKDGVIEVMNCSFLNIDPDPPKDRIPLLAAIDCYCNPEQYSPADLSEGISELAKWFYLPKGWNFLNYVAFLLPAVNKSMIDTAKNNKITLSFDFEESTQLDHLLAYEGPKKSETALFYAYFFENMSSFISVDMPDPSKLLKTLAAPIKEVAENQTETSFINYLSSFSLDPKDHLKNSEQLPIQGEIKNEDTKGFIQLQTLVYNKTEVEKTVSTEGNLTLNYSLLALPNPYDIASQDSLDLIGLLNDSDNVSFYESRTVRTIIDFYWEKSRRYLWYLLAFHIIPVGLFTAFALTRNSDYALASGLLAGVVAITSLLFTAEILQILASFSEYIENPFNFIEFGMLSIQLVNAILFWVDPTSTTVSFFVSLSTILWYFKILILLRVIDQLRKLIHMIVTIIQGIMSFLIVIFAMMVAFTIAMYQSRLASGDETSFWDVALEFYNFGIGAYDASNYSGVTLPFFIIATIMMPLVLLNMLIAIMGDIYGSAKDEAVAIDAKERIAMISEISSTSVQIRKIARYFSCWRRKLTDPKNIYILVAEPYESKEDKPTIEDLITTKNAEIDEVKDEIVTVKTDIGEMKSELKTITENLQKLIEGPTGKFSLNSVYMYFFFFSY